MSSLPLPVRVAAGLVVAAVEEVRDLPRTVVGLPISAVSRVLQLTMRAQQLVTELAIKGDTALEGARPVEEAPSWARFDDDPAPTPLGSDRRAEAIAPYDATADEAWETTLEDTSLEFSDLAPAHVNGDGRPPATPEALPGYETLTVSQLRGRLRSLDLDQLVELLAWESAHDDRPPFVTMLTNRIATVTAEG